MEKAELKEKYCCRCVNADCDCNCIAKYEAPFGSFICDNGEMFEEYESGWIDINDVSAWKEIILPRRDTNTR